jgi:hypothetical protein
VYRKDSLAALELVENLCFDVAVVSKEMPSALPELVFRANRENWLEVLTSGTPEDNVWDLGEFMLAISEGAEEGNWMCCLIDGAWHDGKLFASLSQDDWVLLSKPRLSAKRVN